MQAPVLPATRRGLPEAPVLPACRVGVGKAGNPLVAALQTTQTGPPAVAGPPVRRAGRLRAARTGTPALMQPPARKMEAVLQNTVQIPGRKTHGSPLVLRAMRATSWAALVAPARWRQGVLDQAPGADQATIGADRPIGVDQAVARWRRAGLPLQQSWVEPRYPPGVGPLPQHPRPMLVAFLLVHPQKLRVSFLPMPALTPARPSARDSPKGERRPVYLRRAPASHRPRPECQHGTSNCSKRPKRESTR
mmetsp:Transcript_125225/g.222014  ORF Transcript_125225/g.222014 Transcript_125225/m.222014 type:complete len:249 (+) Transcript_125225:1019-1765(+)